MIKYACDICEATEDVTRISFNTGKQQTEIKTIDGHEDFEYRVEDLDMCNMHIRMLTYYLLNRLTRKEEWEEQIAAYKYMHTIAKNNHQRKEGL